MADNFDVKLSEKYYTPDPSYKQTVWLGDYQKAYDDFLQDPDGFWDRIAHELHWFSPYSKVKEWNYPYARWFTGGKMNITYNCLDRNVINGRRNKVALIWRGEDGSERIFKYRQLYREVQKVANGLKKLGVTRGDRICIYMPMVPEQVISMLACARIGAVHSVVFGGFGASALNSRINGAEAKVVITADATYRRGKSIRYKQVIEEAIINAPSVEYVVVLRRELDQPVEIHSEMEVDFYDLIKDVSHECEPEVMECPGPPLHPLYKRLDRRSQRHCSHLRWLHGSTILPNMSLTSRKMMCTGALPIPAGSPGIPISSTVRWQWVRRSL